MKDATNPYDKFAGLYGAKTYWGYDGADTGDDPFEARTWEQRPMGGRRRPAEWNGFDSDYFDEPDYRPRREPRREPGRGIDRDRREEDFLREGQERSFLSPKRDDFDRRSREEDFLKGGSREPVSEVHSQSQALDLERTALDTDLCTLLCFALGAD